jgi:DNA-binding transcriptional ArsR family regulator
MTENDKARYNAQAKVHKALAHPTRLFIVEQLSKQERCVNELTEMIGVEMPTVSRHLSVLKGAGILEDDKRGAQVFYRLKTTCVMNFFRCVTEVRQAAVNRETALLS